MLVDEKKRAERSLLTRDKNACQGKNRGGEEGEEPTSETPDLSYVYKEREKKGEYQVYI